MIGSAEFSCLYPYRNGGGLWSSPEECSASVLVTHEPTAITSSLVLRVKMNSFLSLQAQ